MSDEAIEERELSDGLPTSIDFQTDMQQIDISHIQVEVQQVHVEMKI